MLCNHSKICEIISEGFSVIKWAHYMHTGIYRGVIYIGKALIEIIVLVLCRSSDDILNFESGW